MDVYHTIIRPLVTEKGLHQSKLSHERTRTRPGRGAAYSFEVNERASKPEIKSAVEKIYNVKVAGVRTSMQVGKQRRFKFKTGMTRHWKKAVVVLKPDFHIDLF
jgi:large subunit ribosomal protein L23